MNWRHITNLKKTNQSLSFPSLVLQHLTKQVELLRQMNDQHARVYEQLDVAARDLEQDNRRLVTDSRLAQQKIRRYHISYLWIWLLHFLIYLVKCSATISFLLPLSSLTETVEGIQTYMESLQTQVEELKTAQVERVKREQSEQRRSLGAQSVSCLKELYDLHHDRYFMSEVKCFITHVLLYSANGRYHRMRTFFVDLLWDKVTVSAVPNSLKLQIPKQHMLDVYSLH